MGDYHEGKTVSEYIDKYNYTHITTIFKNGAIHTLTKDQDNIVLSSVIYFDNGDVYGNVESIDENGKIIFVDNRRRTKN